MPEKRTLENLRGRVGVAFGHAPLFQVEWADRTRLFHADCRRISLLRIFPPRTPSTMLCESTTGSSPLSPPSWEAKEPSALLDGEEVTSEIR